MEFITKNLKTVGIINTILIVAVLIAKGITFLGSPVILKVESIIGAIGLIFGFIYAYKGYKKEGAKYYKLFMYTYFINSIFPVVLTIVDSGLNKSLILPIVLRIIILVCICLLVFVKNFGKTKSFIAIGIVLLINVVRFVSVFFAPNAINAPLITTSLENLLLAIIAFIFVVCKYADKEARGTK